MMGLIGKPGRVDKDDMIEAALFQSGRPIIIVPYIQKDDLNLDHMVCCGDGSPAAARALMLGPRLMLRVSSDKLRLLFVAILVILAAQMGASAFGVNLSR